MLQKEISFDYSGEDADVTAVVEPAVRCWTRGNITE